MRQLLRRLLGLNGRGVSLRRSRRKQARYSVCSVFRSRVLPLSEGLLCRLATFMLSHPSFSRTSFAPKMTAAPPNYMLNPPPLRQASSMTGGSGYMQLQPRTARKPIVTNAATDGWRQGELTPWPGTTMCAGRMTGVVVQFEDWPLRRADDCQNSSRVGRWRQGELSRGASRI